MTSTSTEWLSDTLNGDNWHISPIGDLMEHEREDCACIPRIDPQKREDGTVAWLHVHHSLDGRELGEPDYKT